MIGSFSAGNYPSAFPANCLLKGSMGTVPGEDHEGVKRSLVEQEAEDPWMKLHPQGAASAMSADRVRAIVRGRDGVQELQGDHGA